MTQIDYTETKHWLRTARTLTEALPYMRRYAGKTFVVKYGGHAMVNKELAGVFAQDIVLLRQVGINPIVVHGGGPQIGEMLKKMGIKSEFRGGLRVTDKATVEIVEMVLAGSINKEIVAMINKEGEWAIGLSGKDGNMVFAEKATKRTVDPESKIEEVLDLGFVGEPVAADGQSAVKSGAAERRRVLVCEVYKRRLCPGLRLKPLDEEAQRDRVPAQRRLADRGIAPKIRDRFSERV